MELTVPTIRTYPIETCPHCQRATVALIPCLCLRTARYNWTDFETKIHFSEFPIITQQLDGKEPRPSLTHTTILFTYDRPVYATQPWIWQEKFQLFLTGIRTGAAFPPITGIFADDCVEIWDGHHRFCAHAITGTPVLMQMAEAL